jgi:hypothetical protein
MIAIEWKRLLRDLAIIVVLLLLLLLAMNHFGWKDVLAPTMQIFMLLFASYMGWSIFDRERQEGAMEYLFSLPVSRTRLFLMKLVPRLVVVLLLAGVFNLISAVQKLPFFLTDLQFSLFLISLFLSSLVFSISIKNFLIAFFLTTLGTAGLFQMIRFLDMTRGEVSLALQTFFSLLVFPILFFFLMQAYDMRPPLRFNLRLATSMIILSTLVVGITLLFTTMTWQNIYPVSGKITIQTTVAKSLIKKGGKVTFRYNHPMRYLSEVKGEVYADIGIWQKQGSHLVRLNPETGEYKSIFKSDKWSYHEAIFDRPVLGKQVYFLLTHRHFHNYQTILEVSEGEKTRVIPIEDRTNFNHYCRLAGVCDNPLQLVLFRKPNPYNNGEKVVEVRLVNGKGKARMLFEAEAVATWNNRLLRFTKDNMELYQVGEEVVPVPLKVTGLHKVTSGGPLKGNFIQKFVMLHDGGKYFLFNMETLNLEKLKIKAMPYYYFETSDGLRIIWVKGDEISVSSWEKGRLIVENIWYTKIDPIKKFRRVEVLPAGVVVWNQKQHEVFFFAKKKEVERSGGM